MQFLNNRPNDAQQWQDYQALELIPASVRRSPRWARPFIALLNCITRLLIALRPAPATRKAKVAQLEASLSQLPQATEDLPLVVPHTPMLWMLDPTFDPATVPCRRKRNPADPSTQVWGINTNR